MCYGRVMTFNLLEEPWLTVLAKDGQSQKVGLRRALVEAESFSVYSDPDPGVEVSVLRLMVAVMQAAIQGPSVAQGMLDEYPARQIAQYLDGVEERFDLFHPVNPFFQARHASAVTCRTPNLLAFPFLPGGSKIMVADGYVDEQDQMEPADAARYLICAQAWGNGQATSGPLPGSTNKSTPAGVLAGSIGIYPAGETLAQTLLLNLTPSDDLGTPVWEVESGAAPAGWLGRLAWPARSYLLVANEDETMVVGAHFSAGHPLDNPEAREPHAIYRENGVYLRGTSRKATWRDLPVIYGWEDSGSCEQLREAAHALANRGEALKQCVIYGRDNVGMAVATVQIKMMVPLPVKMLGIETHAQGELVLLMKRTSGAVKGVRAALHGLDPEAAGDIWSEAEPAYLRIIETLAADPDNEALTEQAALTYQSDIKALCLSIFEEQAAALAPKEYGKRKARLLWRLAKEFKQQTKKTQETS